MPSTYSPDLRIELIPNGDQSGTWGTTTNTNLGTLIEDAISGAATVSVIATNQALTAANGAADEARCAALILTTTTGAPFNIFAPPVTKLYVIYNASAYDATIYCSTVLGNTTPTGSGYQIPSGKAVFVRCDGTAFFDAIGHLDNPLPADSGGTGNASYAVGDLLYANTTTSLARLADVATGNVLRSGGVNTAPAWGQVNLATDITGNLPVNNLGGGTGASSTTFWRGDGTWQTPGGGGDVSFTGTAPTASVNQVAVYGATGTSITTGRTYQFRATSAGQAQIQLFEDTDNGTNSIIIQPPATLAADYTLTLPADDGTANQVLTTNGTGTLSWTTITAGTGDVVGPASATNNAVVRFDTTTGKLIQNSVVTISDTGATTGITTLTTSDKITGNGFLSTTSGAGSYNFTASNESIFGSSGLVSISVSGSARIDVTSSEFTPDGDNNMGLGSGSKRWTQVYAVSGTINTSDANTKQDIADLDDAEKRVAMRIKGLIKKFRFRDAVAEKGDAARIHVGVIAQEVRDAFTAEGLDATRYGLFCSDTWWEREEDVYQPFNETTVRKIVVHKTPVEGATEVTQLGVRYDELFAFVIAAM